MESKSDKALIVFRWMVACVWLIVLMGIITVVVNRTASYEQLGVGLIIISTGYLIDKILDATR